MVTDYVNISLTKLLLLFCTPTEPLPSAPPEKELLTELPNTTRFCDVLGCRNPANFVCLLDVDADDEYLCEPCYRNLVLTRPDLKVSYERIGDPELSNQVVSPDSGTTPDAEPA